MSWRDAAFYARNFDQLEPNSWEVLSPEDTAAIKQKEKANTGDLRLRFRCNICIHSDWIRRPDVENHLRGRHQIIDHSDPTTEFEPHSKIPPHPVIFSQTEESSASLTV
ncbi:hypothetical protein M407DRAFT_20371 [Tulasnella calospora MUT 4182]|nr:hypothetical protein M407DRAFT_20371 [Tulasnella calospora MUT 4182]